MLPKLSLVCAALMSAASLFAGNDGLFEDEFANDTLNARTESDAAKSYRFGRREVIFDDNGIHFIKDRNNFDQSFYDDEGPRYPYYQNNSDGEGSVKTSGGTGSNNSGSSTKKKQHRYFYSNLASVELGVSQYASKPFSVSINDSISYMDLNHGFQLGLCVDAVGLPIVSRYLGVGVGIGAKCDFYTFSTKNLTLNKGENCLIHYADTTKPYNKSKLTNTYLTVPVVIEAHLKGLTLMTGVEGNLLVWSNTKMKTSSGEKERSHSNLHQNIFSYNLLAKVEIDCIGVYARANMSPLFIKDKGPEIYPYSVGVSLTF